MHWLTVKEARASVDNKIALSTVYRIAHSGKIRTTRVGRILIHADDWTALVRDTGYEMIQPQAKKGGPTCRTKKTRSAA